MSKSAVHFGAGNIGRGFVGLILHRAGYELVFADVAAPLIEALQQADSYEVREVGEGAHTTTVTGFSAINSATNEADLVAAIATADIVTTAVGPNILKFVAPAIAKGLAARSADLAPLAVMACENAINATDILAAHVREIDADAAAKAIFANTAVDRIVPTQAADAGLNVTVETYFEWAIEQGPFGDAVPTIGDATWVEDLGPYIERKLFTVNTGHATTAYHGFLAGKASIAEAVEDPEVRASVAAVLAETKALLVAKYGFAPEQQQAYIDKILKRFANPELPDVPSRVGRQPLRKLSRNERFIGPAAEAAERGLSTDALVATVAAALKFQVAEDPQCAELAELVAAHDAAGAVTAVTGIAADHPLYPALLEVFSAHEAAA